MNYFERLIRRALLRASRPGVELVDPFETVAEWPLDTPPSAAPIVHPSPPPRPPNLVTTEGHDLARPDAPPALAPPEPPLVPTVDVLEIPAPLTVEVDHATHTVEYLPPPATAPLPVLPAMPLLDRADAFMHGLGVRFPARRVHGAEPTVPALDLPAGLVPPPAEDSEAATPLPRIVAPLPERSHDVPPPALLSPAPDTTPAPPHHDSTSGSRPGRTASPIVETRRVVVVDRHSGTGGTAAITGGGAPRFGLGQL